MGEIEKKCETHVQLLVKTKLMHHKDTVRISEARFWGHQRAWNRDRIHEIEEIWSRESGKIWWRSHRVRQGCVDLKVYRGWRNCIELEWEWWRERWWVSPFLWEMRECVWLCFWVYGVVKVVFFFFRWCFFG